MFEAVAGWSMANSSLLFRAFLAITVLIFSALNIIHIFKGWSAGAYDSEADAMVMVGRVFIFLLIVLVTLIR